MYAVTVRDHVMVAHSLPRPVFGPAQALHGATYVVEATFRRPDLDDDGIVVDIGAALSALGEILDELRYRNLDEHPAFQEVVDLDRGADPLGGRPAGGVAGDRGPGGARGGPEGVAGCLGVLHEKRGETSARRASGRRHSDRRQRLRSRARRRPASRGRRGRGPALRAAGPAGGAA